MLRYILVLLLINASYRSLGNPIKPTTPISLVNSLTTLAGQCENTFLSNQIKNKIIYCSDLSSPHGEKQLQCLIFYDINRQLCAAVGESKIALPEEDYSLKINEEQDVNSLCLTAKDWVFSNLTEFSRYKQAVDKIFKHPVSCGKICGVEDFLSDDANFFCKYFKWGTGVLKQQTTLTSTQQNAINNGQPSPVASNVDNRPVETAISSSDLQDIQIKEISMLDTKSNTPTSNAPVKNDEAGKVDLVKPETSSVPVNQKSQSVEPANLPNVAAIPETQANVDANIVEDAKATAENVNAEDLPIKSSPNIAPKDTAQEVAGKSDTLEKPDSSKKSEAAEKTDEDKEIQLLNNDLDNKLGVLETPKGKQPSDIDDYAAADSEEGKEGLSDMQGGDDGDEPMPGDLDTKLDEQKPAEKAEPVVSSFAGEKETFYTNPVQDAFPEEDDHFFPFFLTAIILVVLLYVLYHNKNKVTKVFFGLVLEGRQATRRRNSRGHAYRRLDTLEQAMSATATAPPSKIIY